MSAGLPFSRREHTSEGTDVIELDTKAAAPADHVTPVNVQRQFAQALPAASLRTKSAGCKAAANKSRADPKAKAAEALRRKKEEGKC